METFLHCVTPNHLIKRQQELLTMLTAFSMEARSLSISLKIRTTMERLTLYRNLLLELKISLLSKKKLVTFQPKFWVIIQR